MMRRGAAIEFNEIASAQTSAPMATAQDETMKIKIGKTSTKPLKPAEVTISVRKFRHVLATARSRTGRTTDYAMRLRGKHPNAFIKGDDIHVRPPGATIRFTIASPARDKERYYPIGIAFVRDGECKAGDAHRLGMLNFLKGRIRAEGRSLSIEDGCHKDSRGARHKFSLVIQRGSDGRIGIIDPGVVHDDEQ